MKLETWKLKTRFKFSFQNAKYILAFLVFVFIILGGVKLGNIINEYVYWQNTKDIYTAALITPPIDYSYMKPFRNWGVANLENIGAQAAIAFVIKDKGESRIVFEKNSSKMLHIASLSKIFTAYIALKNYDLEEKITITKQVVDTEETKGQFRIGEKFTVEELLYSMLIESSNDAAKAIADVMGERQFVKLMNSEAKSMGLNNSHFVDPIGLDPDFPGEGYNHSTVTDLAKMIEHILKESERDPKIAKLFEIIKQAKYTVTLSNGSNHHQAFSTNKLLDDFPNLIGSKTGQTPIAGQCLLMIMPKEKGNGSVVAIILNSNNRFGEMKKIINWIQEAFIW
ncbi:MAG: serine hydrolase [Patescibacteria group bacterium]|nr:serine hydrolase [Patescibacteria group bacterium]